MVSVVCFSLQCQGQAFLVLACFLLGVGNWILQMIHCSNNSAHTAHLPAWACFVFAVPSGRVLGLCQRGLCALQGAAAGVGPESACSLSVSTATGRRDSRGLSAGRFPSPSVRRLSVDVTVSGGSPDRGLTGRCFQQRPAFRQGVPLKASVSGSSHPERLS